MTRPSPQNKQISRKGTASVVRLSKPRVHRDTILFSMRKQRHHFKICRLSVPGNRSSTVRRPSAYLVPINATYVVTYAERSGYQ